MRQSPVSYMVKVVRLLIKSYTHVPLVKFMSLMLKMFVEQTNANVINV